LPGRDGCEIVKTISQSDSMKFITHYERATTRSDGTLERFIGIGGCIRRSIGWPELGSRFECFFFTLIILTRRTS
jgi:hypothetical protein